MVEGRGKRAAVGGAGEVNSKGGAWEGSSRGVVEENRRMGGCTGLMLEFVALTKARLRSWRDWIAREAGLPSS